MPSRGTGVPTAEWQWIRCRPRDGVKQQRGRCPGGCGDKWVRGDSGQLPHSATAPGTCCRDLLLHPPLAGPLWLLKAAISHAAGVTGMWV